MAFDRIITLSLNPVIDTTLHLDGLNIRAENRVLEEHFEAAGKAVNVARALKRAGVESTGDRCGPGQLGPLPKGFFPG